MWRESRKGLIFFAHSLIKNGKIDSTKEQKTYLKVTIDCNINNGFLTFCQSKCRRVSNSRADWMAFDLVTSASSSDRTSVHFMPLYDGCEYHRISICGCEKNTCGMNLRDRNRPVHNYIYPSLMALTVAGGCYKYGSSELWNDMPYFRWADELLL